MSSLSTDTEKNIARIAEALEIIADHMVGVGPECEPEPKPEPKPEPETAKETSKTKPVKAEPEKQTKTLADFEDLDDDLHPDDDVDDDYIEPDVDPQDVIDEFYKLMNGLKDLEPSKGGGMATARTVAKQLAGTYLNGQKPTVGNVKAADTAKFMREIKNVAKIKGV